MALLRVAHFTAAEPDGNLHFVAFLQKAARMGRLCIEVVRVDIQRQTDLLNTDDMLVLFRFFLPLGLFKPVFPIIDNFTDRRNRLRGDFNQIQIHIRSLLQRLRRRHYAKLTA